VRLKADREQHWFWPQAAHRQLRGWKTFVRGALDSLQQPGGPFGGVWTSQILNADLGHEFLFLGAPREKELIGMRAREEDSWICVGATG